MVMNMDKSLVQKRTNKILEKVDKPGEFKKELQVLLKSLVDEKATKNYKRIIPDTGKFYGVPKSILWIIALEIGKFIQKEPTKAKRLLKVIWSEESYEAKQIAGKSLEKFGQKNPTICLDFISSALPDLDNWSVCDSLAMYGVRKIVYSNPKLVLPLSEKWIRNDDKWARRFGIVTLLGYNRIKTNRKVFELLGLVMKGEDKDVRKAVSWILREITKKNPEAVFKFLMKWTKTNPNKDTRWIIKNGLKKLKESHRKEIEEILNKVC